MDLETCVNFIADFTLACNMIGKKRSSVLANVMQIPHERIKKELDCRPLISRDDLLDFIYFLMRRDVFMCKSLIPQSDLGHYVNNVHGYNKKLGLGISLSHDVVSMNGPFPLLEVETHRVRSRHVRRM